MGLVEKYEKLGFLDKVPEDKKYALSKLYQLIIAMSDHRSDIDLRITYLMVPLIKVLFLNHGETDVVKIKQEFLDFYESEPNISERECLLFYIQTYKDSLVNKK